MMGKTKNLSFILLISIFCLLSFNSKVYSMPEISGEGMVLMDSITGDIIASKNPDKPLAPASTTKIMTALLTFENCKLDEIVTVGFNPTMVEGTSIGLKEGDQYSVEELLYALLLESSNDSALALAEHIAGTQEKFAEMMNEKAKSLGANNTNFVNPHGLYEDNHVTTAYDLALIMREVSKIEKFNDICSQTTHEMPASVVDNQTKWVNNRNSLLFKDSQYYYDPLVSGKTGYTTKSRHTYVACAEKDDQRFILSLLNYDSKQAYYEDTKEMFNYGFDNFKTIKLYEKGEVLDTIDLDGNHSLPLLVPEDIYYTIDIANTNIEELKNVTSLEALKDTLNVEFDIDSNNSILPGMDIMKDEEVVSANLKVNGENFNSITLLSGTDISYTKSEILSLNIKNNPVKYIILLITSIILLLVLLLVARIMYVKKKRARRTLRGRTYYSTKNYK